ncbi:MAG: BON domain-containing protein [Chitinophagaceae bacterium]
MKKNLAIAALMAFVFALPSCKSKVKDADIKQSAQTALVSVPSNGELMVNVEKGVVTVTGEVKNDAAKASVEPAVKDIKGVKSVVNNTTVMPVADIPVITPDDPLTIAIRDAVKDNPGVTAQVNDGVVTLTGTIKKSDLTKLMQKINATKPKKIDNKLTVN